MYKKITKQLPFSADFLFDIVRNVESYPSFLPHCKSVRVISSDDNTIFAEMTIEYKTKIKSFSASYVSRVEILPDFFIVSITNAEKSLFKYLKSSWRFCPSIDGCTAEYEISFALQNPLLNLTVGNVFLGYTQTMMNAFVERAQSLLQNKQEVV